jgi:hypothetical protein
MQTDNGDNDKQGVDVLRTEEEFTVIDKFGYVNFECVDKNVMLINKIAGIIFPEKKGAKCESLIVA